MTFKEHYTQQIDDGKESAKRKRTRTWSKKIKRELRNQETSGGRNENQVQMGKKGEQSVSAKST